MTIKFTRMRTTLLVGSMAAVLVGLLIGVSYTETASAGGGSFIQCDNGTGISVHFNKILFSSTAKLTGDGPVVKVDRPYEVISEVFDTSTVIDPIQEVLNVLNANGYAKGNGVPIGAFAVTIIEVELSTICTSILFQ